MVKNCDRGLENIVFKLDEILSERTRMIYSRKCGKIFYKLNNF